MTHVPHVAATNDADWRELGAELDRWEEAGTVARLWWRDDDAVAPTPQLGRLLAIAGGTPLALAAVPADATAALARALDPYPEVAVLHHGWCHANRAGSGKKSEYPAERHAVDVADELDEGRQRMRMLFGARALPVFVPPWNRFAARFVPLLLEAGFTVLSQMAPREGRPFATAERIRSIDVHVDPVDWRRGCGFVGEEPALRRLIEALRRERGGRRDPVGVLTHHLVMDAAGEGFMARLADAVRAHPAAVWADMRALPPQSPVVAL
ncbi:MAG: hypothetical protein JO032_16375 [Alphaproteobacteria bacterium]|nr:hypothetical protein [Alphaproteobacteria bacterium]